MKTSIKLALISSVGSVMALANSWNKVRESEERLKEENETMEKILSLGKEKSEYLSKGRPKKEIITEFDNKINILEEKLKEMKNHVYEETFLDHLDKLTQDLINNYLFILKKNFLSFWEFFTKLTPSAQIIMFVLLGSLFINLIIYLRNNFKKSSSVSQINKDKEEKATAPIVINQYFNNEEQRKNNKN